MVVVKKVSGCTLSFSVKKISNWFMSLTFTFMTISFSPITRFASTTSVNSDIAFKKSLSEPDFTVIRIYANKIIHLLLSSLQNYLNRT